MNRPMTDDEARRVARAMDHYRTVTLRGSDYIVLLLKDGQPIIAADGLPVEYRNRNEAGIDMVQRARMDVARAAIPDDGDDDDDGLGDPSQEGDEYPRKAVQYAA